jgi:hypothetical protein
MLRQRQHIGAGVEDGAQRAAVLSVDGPDELLGEVRGGKRNMLALDRAAATKRSPAGLEVCAKIIVCPLRRFGEALFLGYGQKKAPTEPGL